MVVSGLKNIKVSQSDFTVPSFPTEKKNNTQITFVLLLVLAAIEVTFNQVF